MIYYKSLFIYFLIFSTFLDHYVSSLNTEEIIGGYSAVHSNFKYHVGLVGKYNFSNVTYLLGSAAILNNFFIISAARCFMITTDQLKKISFFAAVGVDFLVPKDLITNEIQEIFTYYYRNYKIKNDLAISKLKYSLHLETSPNLAPLELPGVDDIFYGQSGVVTGFGIDTINDLSKQKRREQIRLNSRNGVLLKYANVTIVNAAAYADEEQLICNEPNKYFTDLCGQILPDEAYSYRGVCMGDNGGPLVIRNKVVGIVSVHSINCDDVTFGTIYTKVSKFKHFIDGVLSARYILGTTVHENNVHISQNPNRNRGGASTS